ncbi:MAG: hypothetical protein NDJ89_13815 [Oligoflexia bacterium]|nr:hypothetical protein [Oligoflexia bacterium]
MKKTILVLAGLCVVMTFAGCRKIKGGLDLARDLPIRVDTLGEGGKLETIKAGNYEADVNFRNKEKIVLKVKDKRFFKTEVVLQVAEGHFISDFNGDFELRSAESKQPFDVVGHVVGSVTTSDTYRDTESCTYYDRELVCREIVTPDWGRERRTECREETVTRTGFQDVEYYYSTTTRDLSLKLLDSTSGEQLGAFTGHRGDSDKNYLHQGPCIGHVAPRPPRY